MEKVTLLNAVFRVRFLRVIMYYYDSFEAVRIYYARENDLRTLGKSFQFMRHDMMPIKAKCVVASPLWTNISGSRNGYIFSYH